MRSMTLNVTTPAPREVWRDLLATDPEAVPYQSLEWFNCVCRVGGYQDASRLYALHGAQFTLPLAKRGAPSHALTRYASQPHAWGMGGLVASRAIQPQDTAAIFTDLARLGALQVALGPNPRSGAVWNASRPSSVDL